MPIRSVVLISLFLLVSSSLSLGEDVLEEPVYQNGECWTFNIVSGKYIGYTTRDIPDGEHRVCFVNGAFASVQDGKRYRLSNFWSFAFPLKERDTYRFIDKFPVAVDQKWSHEYEGVLRGTNRKMRITAEGQVLGWEAVTVPAGTFDTLKIERGLWNGGRMGEKVTFFWSPKTKSAVKYKYEALIESTATRDIELINYRPAPKRKE